MTPKSINFFAIFVFSIFCLSTFADQDCDKNSTSKIQLFTYKNCPYCDKVIKFLKDKGHIDKVELVDASIPTNGKKLKEISGSSQCPYLVDSAYDVAMAESKDIIKYLSTRF